jgi:hypothetical protein
MRHEAMNNQLKTRIRRSAASVLGAITLAISGVAFANPERWQLG